MLFGIMRRSQFPILPVSSPSLIFNRDARFTVGRSEPHCAVRKRINHMIGMRMHGAFLRRLVMNIQNAHVFVIEQHLVMLRVRLSPGLAL